MQFLDPSRHGASIDMRQSYTLTNSLEVGVPMSKNGLKRKKMANKKCAGNSELHIKKNGANNVHFRNL